MKIGNWEGRDKIQDTRCGKEGRERSHSYAVMILPNQGSANGAISSHSGFSPNSCRAMR